jgi:GMP synthase-like glutamine amidotransferase
MKIKLVVLKKRMKVLCISNGIMCLSNDFIYYRLQFPSRDDIMCVDNVVSALKCVVKCRPDLIIFCGSSSQECAFQKTEYMWKSTQMLLRVYDIPILGIDIGMHLLCVLYGGEIKTCDKLQEVEELCIEKGSILFHNTESKSYLVCNDQTEYVSCCPEGFKSYCTIHGRTLVFEDISLLRFGIQFNPEYCNESMCVLENFFKFVYERNTLPESVTHISDSQRKHLVFLLLNREKLHKICSDQHISKELLLVLWRHHMQIWNLDALLL